MSRYTPDSKERVRDAVDMIALVSTKTELRRAGVNSYFGRCPFHDERTGSFHVRPEEKHYHCFGCQESGDPFDFVMQLEGLDFRGALESLADRFGVTLEVEDEDPQAQARRERRERLHALLDRAAVYYARYLWDSAEAGPARRYLAQRGMTEAALRTYRVGYAPSAWDKMLLASRQAGFTEDELLATGLAQRSRQRQGSIYDRFRERIMFPLANARGRVVGFGARAMRDNQRPKYLNTSEGEVFHKGSQLFGIDIARRAAARAGSIVLAEGYTDVLALHQAGVVNAVGVMGTSFTEEQARELERTARTLLLALDADRAGQEAMVRAARIAAGRRLELRVVELPEGEDPADLILREGPDAVRERVARSVPFVSFHVDKILRAADLADAEGKDRAIAELRPVIAGVPPSVLREDLIGRIARRLELTGELARQLLEQGDPSAPAPGAAAPLAGADGPPPADGARAGGGDWDDPGPDWDGPSAEDLDQWAAMDAGGDPGGWSPGDGGGFSPSGGGGARGAGRPPSDRGGRRGAWTPAGNAGGGSPAARPTPAADHARRREREFLALCVAMPREGAATLADFDPETRLADPAARRAAAHLKAAPTRLAAPLADLPDGDAELAAYLDDVARHAATLTDARGVNLENALLTVEVAALDAAIAAASAAGAGGVADLSRRRSRLRERIRRLSAQL